MMTTDAFVKCRRVISMQFFVDSSKNYPRERFFFPMGINNKDETDLDKW